MGKTEIRCGMDSSGKYVEAYYSELLKQLEGYFARKGWKRLFLSGGCYWLARTLKQGINDSVIMVNWTEEHCAFAFGNGLYDITGRIPAEGFHAAGEREICFMEKNYIPGFDTEKLEKYLAEKRKFVPLEKTQDFRFIKNSFRIG